MLYKFKRRYFLKDLFQDDGWSIFAGYLNYLLDSKSFYKIPLDSIRRISQSPTNDGIEELLFQFVNHIGAFILYLLIEAMRPTRKIIPVSMRIDKARDFIQTAIPYLDLFRSFLNILPQAYSKDIVLGAQMRETGLDKLSDAFRRVFPTIHKTLEEGYPQHFQDFYLGVHEDKCEHEWKETFVHKMGKYYKCTMCRSMVKSITEH